MAKSGANAKFEKGNEVSGPASLILDFIENSVLWQRRDCPFKAHVEHGHAKVVLMAGPNASGKSFLAECALSWASAHAETKPMRVSIRERTGSGSGEMSGMRRAMMFGDEQAHSTGAVSGGVVRRAFSSVEGWSKQGLKTFVLLDEPEIGLSEGFGFGMGDLIGREALKMDPSAFGVIVVSHSRALGRGLAKGLGAAPSFVSTGGRLSFKDWCQREEQMSADELLALSERDLSGFRCVTKILDAMKSKNR
jgi:hypothetical protein